MPHWMTYEWEKDPPDVDAAARGRRFMRQQMEERPSDLGQMLSDLELHASPFYLGLDYDDNTSDINEMGPF